MTRKTVFKLISCLTLALGALNFMFIHLKERQLTNKINLFYSRLNDFSSSFNQLKQTSLHEYFDLSDSFAADKEFKQRRIFFNGNYRDGLGYGNLLYSFISSLLIAILTESQFVLRQKNINSKILAPPFNMLQNVSERIGFETNNVMFYLSSFYFTGSKTGQAWLLNKDLNRLVKAKVTIPLGYMRYFYDYIDPLFMEICANPIYYEKLFYYGLVERRTILNALDVVIGLRNDRLIEGNI